MTEDDDFFAIIHDHGKDDTFVIGPFITEADAQAAIDNRPKRCDHKIKIVPMLLSGPVVQVAVAAVAAGSVN